MRPAQLARQLNDCIAVLYRVGYANVGKQLANATGPVVDNLFAASLTRVGISAPFFQEGWGDLGVVDFKEDAQILLGQWPPAHFTVDVRVRWEKKREGVHRKVPYHILEGTFRSPCYGRVLEALPPESHTARVQVLAPKQLPPDAACVIHLAGTGDHWFQRRLNLGFPLVAEGVATVALESPYYGQRRPARQQGSKLHRVSDLLTLGRATIEEALFLLHWARHEEGYPRLGLCGFSMGGVHASMAAGVYPAPVACIPLLAPRSAAIAFCHGALWDATAWQPLVREADEAQRDIATVVSQAARANVFTTAALHVQRLQDDLAGIQRGLPAALDDGSQLVPGPGTGASSPGQGVGSSSPVQEAASALSRAQGLVTAARSWLHWAPLMLQPPATARPASGKTASGAPRWALRGAASWGQIEAARQRLDQVLETYTDVTRFPKPRNTCACILVGAEADAYVSKQSVQELAHYWDDAEVRWVSGGHVSAFITQQPAFRSAIQDALQRLC